MKDCADTRRICRIGEQVEADLPLEEDPSRSEWRTFKVVRAHDDPETGRLMFVVAEFIQLYLNGPKTACTHVVAAADCRPAAV